MLKNVLIAAVIISVAGIVGSEIMLFISIATKMPSERTREAGKYTLVFLAALTVAVMLLMAMGRK